MNPQSNLFPYILENLSLYNPEPIGMIVGIVLGVVFSLGVYYVLLYMKVLILVQQEQKAIEKKKHILGNLILMKDIQTELEAEIEKAMLKSTFQ